MRLRVTATIFDGAKYCCREIYDGEVDDFKFENNYFHNEIRDHIESVKEGKYG